MEGNLKIDHSHYDEKEKRKCEEEEKSGKGLFDVAYQEERNFDDDEETQVHIRKLLNQTSNFTLKGSGKSLKEPIDHVGANYNPLQTKIDGNGVNNKKVGSMTSGKTTTSQSRSSKLRPKRTKYNDEEGGDIMKIRSAEEYKNESQGQRSKVSDVKSGKLSSRRHPPSLGLIVKSHSISNQGSADQGHSKVKGQLSSSMSILLSTSQLSLNVNRRSSCGVERDGRSGSSFKTSCTTRQYGSGHSSLSPSPSPQRSSRRGDIDPLTLRRLYWLQRNGMSESGNTVSKLNIPTSRPASLRSARSINSSLKGGPLPLVRDPLNHSFYRNCRSNSFAFSMDIKNTAPLKDLPPRERRHRKVGYAIIIFSSLLLLLAVLCIVISLHFSSLEEKSKKTHVNVTISSELRKENEDLLRSIIQTPSSHNVSWSATSSIPLVTSPTPPPPPPPPESLREYSNTNNIISISNLHLEQHRGTKVTTTTKTLRTVLVGVSSTTRPLPKIADLRRTLEFKKSENLELGEDTSTLYSKNRNSQQKGMESIEGNLFDGPQDRDEASSLIPAATYG